MSNTLILALIVFLFVFLWHILFSRFDNEVRSGSLFRKLVLDLTFVIFAGWLLYLLHLPLYGFLLSSFLVLVIWYGLIYWTNSSKSKQPIKQRHLECLECLENHEYSTLQKLGIDLLIGLTMAIFLSGFEEFPWLRGIEDVTMDFVMELNRCEPSCEFPVKENIPIVPTVLVDIDDETHKQWKEPLFTPRNRIQQLIDTAVTDNAKVVVLDIFTTQETPTEGLNCSDIQQNEVVSFTTQKISTNMVCRSVSSFYDEELKNYLASYKTNHCGEGKKCPPIIMIRGLNQVGEKSQTEDKLPIHQPRKSFMDEVVKNSYPYVQWASPWFSGSLHDGVLRRWWLWQPVCDKDRNSAEWIPSVQLSVVGFISSNELDIKGKLEEVNKTVECSKSDYEPRELSEIQSTFLRNLKITEGAFTGVGIAQRIMFTIPWRSPTQEDNGVRKYNLTTPKKIYNQVLTVLPAHSYLVEETRKKELNRLKKPPYESPIVIIGSSHIDASDLHQTPLGQMPGALVIVNAIYSLLLNQGEIGFSAKLGKLLVETFLILITGFFIIKVNSRFNSSALFWIVMVLVGIGIWFISQLGSAYLLKRGLWMDFSLPLVAILFHHIAEELHELKKLKKCLKQHKDKVESLQNQKTDIHVKSATNINGGQQNSQIETKLTNEPLVKT